MISTSQHTIRIIAVGDELGFELPQQIINRHQLHEGDDIYLSWTATGLYLRFTPPESELADRDGCPGESK